MEGKEAVKDKARYQEIVAYFQGQRIQDPEALAQMIDIIELMSEEIYEHYRAMADLFKENVSWLLDKREREGSFGFLTEEQRRRLSYTLEKAGRLKVLLWEKYEEYNEELKRDLGKNRR